MKRTPLKRKTPLRSSSPSLLRRSTLSASGETKKKREKRTAQKRQSAHTRQWRKDVLSRDGHRCTAYVEYVPRVNGHYRQCDVTEDLHVHHMTYRRMGAERLEDGFTLCRKHHEMVESKVRWYKRLGNR